LLVYSLGTVPYADTLDLQRRLHAARARGETPDTLLLLEHPPTYTIGRQGDGSHLLVPESELRRLGAELHWVDRGGDITFHGPGQIVGYPILYLGSPWPDLPAYLRKLESVLIDAVGELGAPARVIPGFTGVWAGREKLASLGAKVTRGVTMHGFALNVNVDLSWFDLIHPCGLVRRKATSLSRLFGKDVDMEIVGRLLAERLGKAFGGRPEWATETARLAAF